MSVSIVGSDGSLIKAAQTGFSGADELTKSIQNVSLLKEDITKSLDDDTTNEKVPGALLVKNLISTTLTDAKAYVDQCIKSLIGTTPETLDTLEEIANAIENHVEVVEAMEISLTENAKTYTDTQTASTLAEAKEYADNAGEKYSTCDFTIPASSSGTVTLTNSRITTDLNPLCTLNSGSATDYAKISSITTNNGSISVVLSSATSAALVITLHGIPE